LNLGVIFHAENIQPIQHTNLCRRSSQKKSVPLQAFISWPKDDNFGMVKAKGSFATDDGLAYFTGEKPNGWPWGIGLTETV